MPFAHEHGASLRVKETAKSRLHKSCHFALGSIGVVKKRKDSDGPRADEYMLFFADAPEPKLQNIWFLEDDLEAA